MDVLNRIKELNKQKNWSIYKLSIESGITTSTLTNMFARKTMPSIATLSALCEAFDISLAEFFVEDNFGAILNKEENELLVNYRKLTEQNKQAVIELCKNLK